MEENKHILSNALRKLADYVPDDQLWDSIQQKLQEDKLCEALQNLPEYSPQPMAWEKISQELPRRHTSVTWWYAASVLLIAGLSAALIYSKGFDKHIDFSQERADLRLQADKLPETDLAYQQLAAYCQTETLVCARKDYKLLKDEYEKLEMASEQLHQAIGSYNTEPELVRQFNNVERQKTAILNEMAKMI
jgi:hypothetical protein